MKKILKIFLIFSLGIFMSSCDPKSHEIIDENPKVQEMDSMRTMLNRIEDQGAFGYGTPPEQDVIDHVFGQAKDRRWDRGTSKTHYKTSEHQLWAIWFDNYTPEGNTFLNDYKHNRNYVVVLTKYGPQSLHGGIEIMDINGTIYYGFKIALRLE